jgi:arsenite methyltransferase
VINLSPDKPAVFAEAAWVLRPGGRLALSDIVTDRPIIARTVEQADLWAACIAGASRRDAYVREIATAGLDLEALVENPAYGFTSERAQRTSTEYGARSISLVARKPVSAIHTRTQTE